MRKKNKIIKGVCHECNVPQDPKNAKAKPEVELPKTELSLCFHCDECYMQKVSK